MNKQQLKQRMVGAIVLVALGVIFIPIILDRNNDSPVISGTNIKSKPRELEQLRNRTLPQPMPAPEQPAVTRSPVDENLPDNEEVKKPEEKAEAEINDKQVTAATNSKTERAWVVQVASLSKRDSALALRDKLKKQGMTAFVEAVKTSKGATLYRVRVGPFASRQDAEKMQKRISDKLKLKGDVLAHP